MSSMDQKVYGFGWFIHCREMQRALDLYRKVVNEQPGPESIMRFFFYALRNANVTTVCEMAKIDSDHTESNLEGYMILTIVRGSLDIFRAVISMAEIKHPEWLKEKFEANLRLIVCVLDKESGGTGPTAKKLGLTTSQASDELSKQMAEILFTRCGVDQQAILKVLHSDLHEIPDIPLTTEYLLSQFKLGWMSSVVNGKNVYLLAFRARNRHLFKKAYERCERKWDQSKTFQTCVRFSGKKMSRDVMEVIMFHFYNY